MTDNLLRYQNRQKFLTLDVESNALNLCTTKPWQIAWITCEGKNVIGEFERKIWWPDYEIDDQIAALNHFDRYQYEQEAKDPLEVMSELWGYISNPEYLVVGQNFLNFDCYVLNTWRKILNLPPDYSYIERVLDTKAIEMAIAKDSKCPPKNDRLSWMYTWLNHKEKGIKTSQAHMLKKYGIEHDPSKLHEALVDVKMTFEILKKQLWQVEI
ncbi:MAG: hypothetical protein FMNOHCHN_03427 [Ignavibacteriaceae bacterium]|nr:hypothetical protein [Ignavibacteriaceae bacterium]